MDFKRFSQLVMIEQTLFALPFALIGVLFAGGGTFMTWVWVIIALTAARTAGMSYNRVLDAEIDARNPRTSDRALPRGEVSSGSVWLTAIIASLAFILAALMLNRLCFYLSFLAVFLLFTYSFLKRFTASSHFYLGLIEAAAPIGGYIAVTGRVDGLAIALGIAIMAWIAGLDIIYALQDVDFDTREKLHSLPVLLGKDLALKVSAACYAITLATLTLAGLITQKSVPYWIALLIIGAILLYQQLLARQADTGRATPKIFKLNMLIAPVLFSGTVISVWT